MAAVGSLSNRGNREWSMATASQQRTVVVVSLVVGISASYFKLCSDHFKKSFFLAPTKLVLCAATHPIMNIIVKECLR